MFPNLHLLFEMIACSMFLNLVSLKQVLSIKRQRPIVLSSGDNEMEGDLDAAAELEAHVQLSLAEFSSLAPPDTQLTAEDGRAPSPAQLFELEAAELELEAEEAELERMIAEKKVRDERRRSQAPVTGRNAADDEEGQQRASIARPAAQRPPSIAVAVTDETLAVRRFGHSAHKSAH